MEPQLQHTQGHHYEEQEILTDHHDHNEDGEKKSMMQRAKDRARRIKDSITKHGHGHQQHDDDVVVDDDDNEDETVKVHDSPKYDSDAKLTQPSGNLERPPVIAKDRYTNKPVASHGPLPTVPAGVDETNLSGQSGLGGQHHQGYGQEVNPEEKEEVPFAPNPATVPTPESEQTYGTEHPFENRGQDGTHGGLKSSIEKSGLGSGSGSDPANYETEVTNPTHTDAILTQPSDNLERPSAIAEDRYTKPVASHDPPLTVPAGADETNLSGQSGLGGQQHQGYGQEVNPEEKEEVPFAPNPATVPNPETEHAYGTKDAFGPFKNHGQDGSHGGSESSIGEATGMMKVPHAPSGLDLGSDPENYETKVTNPTHTDAILTQPSDNLERPSVIAEDRYTKPVASYDQPLTVPGGTDETNLSGQSGLDGQQHQGYGQEVNPEEKEEVPFAPNPAMVPTPETEHTYGTEHPFENRAQDGTHGGLKSGIGESTGMMKGPHALSGLGSGSSSDPANYETKVTNPTDTVYDSDAILTEPSGNLERPSAEDHYTKPVASHDPPLTIPAGTDETNLSGQSGLDGQQHQVSGQEVNPENRRSKIEQPTGMEEEVPFAPNPATVPTPVTKHTYGTEHPIENHGQDGTDGVLQSGTGESAGMMKVPHAPSGLGSGSGSDPANYETEVTDPTTHTGGKEAGLSQMQHSFDKMGIQDSGSERKRFDPEDPENIQRATLSGNQSTQSSSYTGKISSIASAIASKLGYSGEHPTTAESHENVKNSGSTAGNVSADKNVTERSE